MNDHKFLSLRLSNCFVFVFFVYFYIQNVSCHSHMLTQMNLRFFVEI
jgi:hypothetical protein